MVVNIWTKYILWDGSHRQEGNSYLSWLLDQHTRFPLFQPQYGRQERQGWLIEETSASMPLIVDDNCE